MNKKALSETDIRSKFITPALCGSGGAGWDLMTQIPEGEYQRIEQILELLAV